MEAAAKFLRPGLEHRQSQQCVEEARQAHTRMIFFSLTRQHPSSKFYLRTPTAEAEVFTEVAEEVGVVGAVGGAVAVAVVVVVAAREEQSALR